MSSIISLFMSFFVDNSYDKVFILSCCIQSCLSIHCKSKILSIIDIFFIIKYVDHFCY